MGVVIFGLGLMFIAISLTALIENNKRIQLDSNKKILAVNLKNHIVWRR